MKDTNEFQTNLNNYCSNCNINRFLAVCYTWGVSINQITKNSQIYIRICQKKKRKFLNLKLNHNLLANDLRGLS